MTILIRAGMALAFGTSILLAGISAAHEYVAGPLKIVHPWSRATPPGATVGAGYMKIINQGATPIRFLGGSTSAAQRVEIHTMIVDGGVMRMRPVTGGLVVPAGGQVALKPGGAHLMLIGLKKPLVEEDMVPLTLMFDGGVTVDVDLYIESMGAPSSGHEGH